jgi:anti-anti-sigma factor
MDIEIQETDRGYRLVKLNGALRMDAGQDVQEALHPLIGERGSAMVVDLSGVSTIDSAGLGQLISLATHARLSQSRLAVVSPTPFVVEVLKMTQLDNWFDMADDVPAAEKLLQK